MRRGEDIVATIDKGVGEKLNHLVRPIAENNVFRFDTEFGGNRLTQVTTAAVRIQMCILQGGAHRGNCFR